MVKLFIYCRKGDIKAVENELKLGEDNDYNWGLQGACEGGNLQIVHLMLKQGANDYNTGLEYACMGGHMQIVELMLKLGATDYNIGFRNACGEGHMQIVELMLKLGATDYNSGFRNACGEGHMQIVELMLKLGATDYSAGLCNAYWAGYIQIINRIIKRNPNIVRCFYNYNTNPSKVILLLETNLDTIYLKNIDGYDKLTNNLNKFKQETSSSLSQYLLDPLICIIISYSVL
jgi:hypothetical protein